MATRQNDFFDAGFSDESEHDEGYDSEAAEQAKGRALSGRPSKRRRLTLDDKDDVGSAEEDAQSPAQPGDAEFEDEADEEEPAASTSHKSSKATIPRPRNEPSSTDQLSRKPPDKPKKKKTPGVIYLSSLPPYLKPSALRNLLSQRGFEPITRLFLAPSSKAKAGSKKNSRQLYTEGWIEFASKKTARACAESLNAGPVGGKKGGFYHDDVWNMKYLKGMAWAELMAGVREERREEEGRRDEERRTIARETKGFLEGVEEGKRVEGMKRKKAEKSKGGGEEAKDEVKRTWRQFESKGRDAHPRAQAQVRPVVNETARRVLGKIF
jgi:ESF2/ABP1 family protein